MPNNCHTSVLKTAIISSDEEYLFLVMDYFPTSLFSVLRQSSSLSFKESHIKLILYNFLCAIQYLHSANVMHRDIKPANILIDSSFNLKICDFGYARATLKEETRQNPKLKPRRRLTQHICTRCYRPPEIILLESHYNQAVDLWGVGCIAAELLKSQSNYASS